MMLQDRVALVTGAGGGIGRALCLGLAREGAVVIATDRSEEACRSTADAVTAAGGGPNGPRWTSPTARAARPP